VRRLHIAANVLIVAASCGFGTVVVTGDEWMLSEPASFHARGMLLVAEVFPPASRRNAGSHALCYFYELGYPGTRWDVKPKLRWKRELANDRMPVEAIVSMDGWLVTFNDWGAMGHAHAIVVYSPDGRLVADWSGDQLFADPSLAQIARQRMSVSSIWWNEKAKYYFARDKTLFIGLTGQLVVRIDLAGASYRVGPPARFREYAAVSADANALTEVWKTSLRFSSITDILAVRAGG